MQAEHVVVFKEASVFAGWPANHGLWQRDGRIIVGFETGLMSLDGGFHSIGRSSAVTPMMAETQDGGETWRCWEPHGELELRRDRRFLSGYEQKRCESSLFAQTTAVDFRSCLAKFRMFSMSTGASYVNYSGDLATTWTGPFRLEGNEVDTMMGRAGIAARTSYLTDSDNGRYCLAFMSASKASDGREGQPFCIETRDGGITWDFLSWIDEPPVAGFGIMPSGLRLDDGSILCAVRWRESQDYPMYGTEDAPFLSGIICYVSDDNARSWRKVSVPVRGLASAGNPPDMVQLPDRRIALVYGRRAARLGSPLVSNAIMVQTSTDNGLTWSAPKAIRDGAGCHDMGYTRSAVRPDGKVVTVYYWNDEPDGERYIAGTIWEP